MKTYIEFLKINKLNSFPKELLIEGLIKSIGYDIMYVNLKKIFGEYNNIVVSHLGIDLYIHKKYFNKKIYNDFKNLLNISGYVVSYFNFDSGEEYKRNINELDIFKQNYEIIKIHLIKKFDIESGGIPEKLYHVTKTIFLDKILKKGLISKSGNKIENHPERIYFTDSMVGAENFKSILIDMYGDEDYKILEINTMLLNHIKLYYDPTYFENVDDYNEYEYKAYYTYDNISPLSISII